MVREGGCEWYQSIGLKFLYISADSKKIFKGPRPFKKQKTNLRGLTTFHVALLDHGASGVENCIGERPMFKSRYPGAPHSAILATAEQSAPG
jgi:hypothetical protein